MPGSAVIDPWGSTVGTRSYVSDNGQKKYVQSMRYFDFLTLLAHVMGVVMLSVNGYVFGTLNDGLQWAAYDKNNPNVRYYGFFNYHTLFATLGLVFFQGEAILSFRIYRHEDRLLANSISTIFHVLALALGAFAFALNIKRINDLKAANQPTPDTMATFYDWISVGILVIYTLHLLFGFVNFVFPKTSRRFRHGVRRWYSNASYVIFALSVAQVVGANFFYLFEPDGCMLHLSCPHNLGLLHNFAVLFVLIYAGLIGILILNKGWKTATS